MANAVRAVVRGVGELCITLGAFLLLFVAWQLWWTDLTADREQAAITAELKLEWDDAQPASAPSPTATTATTAPAAPAGYGPPPVPGEVPAPGAAFAILHVPTFGPDYQPRPVLQGTSLDLLESGLGHYADSALPGSVGNFAVAGHRVTYGRPFNQIAELRAGDPIVVETADAWYVYRMRSADIVQPHQVEVVAPVPGDPGALPTERLLTLTACHPMYSARERYIVHAELDRWQPKSAGRPAELTEGV